MVNKVTDVVLLFFKHNCACLKECKEEKKHLESFWNLYSGFKHSNPNSGIQKTKLGFKILFKPKKF